MIDVVVLFFLLLPFLCVCVGRPVVCCTSYLICWFQSIIQKIPPSAYSVQILKFFAGCVIAFFFLLPSFILIGVSSIALFSSTWKGDFIYNYHWRCPFFFYLSWYCFASPKFLNWIPLSNFHFLFTQFMGRRFFLGRPNSTRRRTRPTLRFRSRQR